MINPCRDFAHLIVPDAVAEAEIPGDGDAGRLLVGAEQPLLRDGGPVGKVARGRFNIKISASVQKSLENWLEIPYQKKKSFSR